MMTTRSWRLALTMAAWSQAPYENNGKFTRRAP